MAQIAVSFLVGLLFAFGICLAGMTLPQNIIGFLWLGDWRPALALVMVGGIGVYAAMLRFTLPRGKPILRPKFELPTNRDITPQLVGGAAIFGVGWGLGGFCGGPALVSLSAGHTEVLVFLAMMFLGMWLNRLVNKH